MKSLANKVTVITGSTRGFGYTIAEEMLKAGATVVITGRTQNTLDKALEELRNLGEVHGKICDVTSEAQVRQLAASTIAEHGKIDIWINNAGFSTGSGRLMDYSPQDAIDMFMTNDLGVFHGTRAALDFILPRGEGTLVNIYGAGSFLRPATPMGIYGMTKAWLTSFTRTLAKETRGSGIQIIGFSPGMMLTDMLLQPTVIGKAAKEDMKNFGFVLRMLAKPPEVSAARLVKLLATNKKHFVEHRTIRPWTPFLGILKILWENVTKTGYRPEFEISYREAYRGE